jgi:hypothetical protein
MLNEYACAMDGTGQRELSDCIANVRLVPPLSVGGPNPAGNVPSRVSAIRQGVIATNTSEPAGVAAKEELTSLETALSASGFGSGFACSRLSAGEGWKYNGAGQLLSGT